MKDTSLKEHDMQHKKYMKYVIGVFAVFALLGCEKAGEKAGGTIAETVISFFFGLGKGIEEKMEVKVESDPSLESNGLKITTGKDSGQTSSIYVISSKPFKGDLVVKALDESGNEIGRAQSSVDLGTGGNYVDVKFPAQMNSSQVRKFLVSAHKG